MSRSDDEWERSGGLFCRRCEREIVRVFHGLCLDCHREEEARRIEKQEKKMQKRYYWNELMKGRATLSELRSLGRPRRKDKKC